MTDPPRVTFFVPGRPEGKSRLRSRLVHTRDGRQFVHQYTPEATLSYEAKIATFASDAMHGREPFPQGMPLKCRIVAAFLPAPSWSRKKREQALSGLIRPTGKPDGDNLCKVVGDAINAVVWHDDAAVVEWHIRKVYGDVAELRVEVEPVEMMDAREVAARRSAVAADLFAGVG